MQASAFLTLRYSSFFHGDLYLSGISVRIQLLTNNCHEFKMKVTTSNFFNQKLQNDENQNPRAFFSCQQKLIFSSYFTTEINQDSSPSEQQLPAAHPPQITQSSSILPYQLPNSSPFLTAYNDFNSISSSSTTPKCTCEDLFDKSNTSPDTQYLKTFEYSDAFGSNTELERTRLRRANRGHHFYLRNEKPKSKSLQSSISQLKNNDKIEDFEPVQNEILQKFDSGIPISQRWATAVYYMRGGV